jgi:hypothetical protein
VPVVERLELSPSELSEGALSLRLDPKSDKNMPPWLRRTVDNVIYYLEVPAEPTAFGKIWHHRLRVPVLYAMLGITIALVANAFDVLRIYRMRGETIDLNALLAERQALVLSMKGDEANSLAGVRAEFNQRLFGIEYTNAVGIRSWPNEYLAKLEDLKDKFREKGKFMPWMDVKKEQDRFLSEQAILERNLAKDPPELRELQTQYYSIEDRLNAGMKHRQKALHDDFISRLQELQKAFTSGKQTGDVHAVEVEIEYLKKNMTTLGLDALPEEPEVPATAAEPAATNAPAGQAAPAATNQPPGQAAPAATNAPKPG